MRKISERRNGLNNIQSFKSELVSKVIDAIFNTDISFHEVIQLSNVTKVFDFFGEVEKTAEKVVGDFIVKNFKFIKEGRIMYSPGLATKVMISCGISMPDSTQNSCNLCP